MNDTFSDIGDNYTEIVVIPETIEASSVNVNGSWDNFNITWEPITKVNFGKVLYEIKVDNEYKNGTPVILFENICELILYFIDFVLDNN